MSVAHDTLLSPTGEYLAFPQAGRRAGADPGDRARGVPSTPRDRVPPRCTGRGTPTCGCRRPARAAGGRCTPCSTGRARGPTPRGTGGAVRRRAPGRTGGGGWAPAGWRRAGRGCRACRWPAARSPPRRCCSSRGTSGRTTRCWCSAPRRRREAAAAGLLLRGGVLAGRPTSSSTARRAQPGRLVAWRVGTHEVRRVTTIGGFDPDREVVDSSYAVGSGRDR